MKKDLQPEWNMQTDTIKKAWQSKLLCECTDKELAQRLTLIYFIIGLRSHHFPTKEEDFILFNYIRKKYGNRTIDEFYLAFDLAINNKLDIDDHKVYDQFSIEYLVKIMNAYGRYVFALMKDEKKQVKQIESMPLTKEEKQKDIADFLNQKEINSKFLPVYLYDWMNELNMLNYTDEERIKFYAVAIRAKKVELEIDALKHADDLNKRQLLQQFNHYIKTEFKDAPDDVIKSVYTLYKKTILINEHKKQKK